MNSDKEIERKRYNDRALTVLSENETDGVPSSAISGSRTLPIVLRGPYLCFESQIEKYAPNDSGAILEVGAGTGEHTGVLLATGAHVTASDISEHSLEVVKKRYKGASNFETKVADMESLPFEDESFDVVSIAGSLSYGDNQKVMGEIYRVLKRDGVFIAVDSLNHNPIYRLNRWIHYLRGDRSLSTLRRMPTLSLINSYGDQFGSIQVYYFGAITWLVPLMKIMLDEQRATRISDTIDEVLGVRKAAFKFVMVAMKE